MVHGSEAIAVDKTNLTLDYLNTLSIEELITVWHQRLGTDPPRIRSLDLVVRLLAWKLQERDVGGLTQETKSRLRRLARANKDFPDRTKRVQRKVTPGTVLVREWKGTTHHVAITGTGYEYAETCYQSLSEVARTITGTRWSGPLFFGLKSVKGRAT